jgi:hypothetical protein
LSRSSLLTSRRLRRNSVECSRFFDRFVKMCCVRSFLRCCVEIRSICS